jgi:hypothetical protein
VRVRNSSWSTAVSATLHCLTGCAIGEVLGMVLSTWWGWGNAGAMAAGLATSLFWWSLALSLAIAFVITVPVNRWLISRGRGHAVVHAMHEH